LRSLVTGAGDCPFPIPKTDAKLSAIGTFWEDNKTYPEWEAVHEIILQPGKPTPG
jgi:hypothetical protein